jgi:DNA-nicking Smr family endonuclease
MDDDYDFPDEEPVEIPINGVLDLHTFSPSEVKELVPDYIDACLEKGITQIRIIHGKGKGVLREIVRSALDRHPEVLRYWQEEGSGGGWGATIVALRPR